MCCRRQIGRIPVASAISAPSPGSGADRPQSGAPSDLPGASRGTWPMGFIAIVANSAADTSKGARRRTSRLDERNQPSAATAASSNAVMENSVRSTWPTMTGWANFVHRDALANVGIILRLRQWRKCLGATPWTPASRWRLASLGLAASLTRDCRHTRHSLVVKELLIGSRSIGHL